MKRIITAIFIAGLCFAANASYLGDSISVTGVPFGAQTSAIIDQSAVEISAEGLSGVETLCALSPSAQFFCGDAQLTYIFELDIFELGNGDLQVDVTLGGFISDFSVTLGGFDSTDKIISNVSVTNEARSNLVYFIDPPDQSFNVFGSPSIVDAGLVNLSTQDDSLSFSFATSSPVPQSLYNNTFSLLVETSEVPLPTTAWLFSSALISLGGLKRKN